MLPEKRQMFASVSQFESGFVEVTMQYPPTGSTHLPARKKEVSPYKMPNFTYTVFDQN
jgi:hypothetical protein